MPRLMLLLHLFFEFPDGYSIGTSSKIEQQEGRIGRMLVLVVLGCCVHWLHYFVQLSWLVLAVSVLCDP